MKILKNGIELSIITLQQYSTNNDILTFEFEKPLNFSIADSLVQIIYEVDKLDNVKNNNITIQETENTVIITWLVRESITLTEGNKRVQIIIKNNDSVYLSNVFIIKVLESLNIDNEIVETNLSYLEYWEQRITEVAKKVEEFEGLDLEQYITETDLNESLTNYFDKFEIEEKLQEKANISSVYLKNDTYTKTEVDQLLNNMDISDQLSDLATKEELNIKLDKSIYNNDKATIQLKNDSNLTTSNKTIVGAINEVNDKVNNSKLQIKAGNGVNIYDNTISLKVDGTSVMFDENGQLKAQLNIGRDEGNVNIKQYILKDIKSGTLYTIEDENLPINHKVIPCVLALENSKNTTTSITDFKLDIEDISSNNNIKIQSNYYLDINKESPIINKSNFNKILGFSGGV